MYKPETILIGESSVRRYDLNQKSAPREMILELITPLWQGYEKELRQNELINALGIKPGRMIDIVYDKYGVISGFYIFRMFQFANWNVMFRGNSFSSPNIRSLGAHLIKMSLKQLKPDRIVTFTPQSRAYAFLKCFGTILPSNTGRVSNDEIKLLSLLAGEKNIIDPDTLLIKNFYNYCHKQIGRTPNNMYINDIFSKLGPYDAYGVIVRCNQFRLNILREHCSLFCLQILLTLSYRLKCVDYMVHSSHGRCGNCCGQ